MINAVALPEVVSAILATLADDRRTLARCARLNRLWYYETVRVLWSGTPSGRQFKFVARSSRRKYYASFVQELDMSLIDREFMVRFSKELTFTSLKRLTINESVMADCDFVFSCLVPSLRVLILKDCTRLSHKELSVLPRHCPQLKEIRFGLLQSIGPETIVYVIQYLRYLECIEVTLDLQLDLSVLSAAASRPALKSLTIPYIAKPMVHRSLSFQSLQEFTCHSVDSVSTLSSILQMAPRLRKLDVLMTASAGPNALRTIATRCPLLRHLAVDFEYPFRIAELEGTRCRLPHLRELLLMTKPRAGVCSDGDLALLGKNFPLLSKLTLEMKTFEVSMDGVCVLGLRCQFLEELRLLYGPTRPLRNISPRSSSARCPFPRLTRLEMELSHEVYDDTRFMSAVFPVLQKSKQQYY